MTGDTGRRGSTIDFVGIPTLLLIGALAMDVAGTLLDGSALFILAFYLIPAGVAARVLAAALQWSRSRSGDSSEMHRPSRPYLAPFITIIALLLFLLAWWLRGEAGLPPDGVLIGLEVIACALLVGSLLRGRSKRLGGEISEVSSATTANG